VAVCCGGSQRLLRFLASPEESIIKQPGYSWAIAPWETGSIKPKTPEVIKVKVTFKGLNIFRNSP
jgi:hypothetical protein